MRIAALCDIHGNMPALEAVMREVRAAGVDRIVAGGDVVVGPDSREAMAYLLGLDLPVDFVHGNCETAVLNAMAGLDPGRMPEDAKAAVRWTADSLKPDYEAVLAGWPLTARIHVSGIGDVVFCHATPRHDNEIFVRTTAEERLIGIFAPLNAAIVVCGHTHMAFDRTVGRTRVINAGSVGMPFGAPGADWLLLGPGVELRHTNYDLDAAAARIRATAYPGAQEWTDKYLLRPPSAEQMLELFRQHELET